MQNRVPRTEPGSSVEEKLITQLQPKSPTSTKDGRPGPVSQLTEHAKSPGVENACEGRVQQPKLTLTHYATPASSVSAFCRAVLLKLIPSKFFGDGPDGLFNQRLIMKHVDSFIKMRRFESLSLHEVCHGLKVCSLPAPNDEKQL